jgi:hypothetical protein
MRSLLFLVLCATAFGLVACGDGNLGRAFSVDIQVEDIGGDPVEGLRVQLHIPIDGISIKAAEKRAKTVIEFSVPRQVYGELTILTVDGEIIRDLFAGDLPAGFHIVSFDGKDNEGAELFGTVPFLVEAVFYESAEGREVWRDTNACVLYTALDAGRQTVLGWTDEEGKLEIDEGAEFPFLGELPTFESHDEEGQPQGEFTLSSNVELRFIDESDGSYQVVIADITAFKNIVDVVWNPTVPSSERLEEPSSPSRQKGVPEVPGPAIFALDVCTPNPFN